MTGHSSYQKYNKSIKYHQNLLREADVHRRLCEKLYHQNKPDNTMHVM